MILRRASMTAALAAGMAALSFRGFYEPDLWWHLAHGRENAAGTLVRSNVFSFMFADYRQHYTSWLFDSLAFLSWQAGGGAAIQILQAALLALTFALLYKACRVRGSAAAACCILTIAFFVIEPRAIPRPHLVSFAGLAACALAIERALAAKSAAPLRWTILVVALWSNFHVEVVFGVLFVAIAGVAEAVHPAALPRPEARRATLVAIGTALATVATPYGWGLIAYTYENSSVPSVLSIAELLPPDLVTYRAFYLYLGLVVALLAIEPRRLTLREALTAVAFAALGLKYLRLTPLIVLATAPMLTARLTALLARGIDARAAVVTAAVLGLAVSRMPPVAFVRALKVGDAAVRPEGFFSERAVTFAREQGLDGPVFNSNNLGGYAAWTLYPEARIFQDSRLQAYPPAWFVTIIRASQSQEEWDVLTSGVDWALLSLQRPNQLSGIGRFPRVTWATVFWDEAAQILVRRESRHAALAGSRELRWILPGADPLAVFAGMAAGERDRILAEAMRNRIDNPRGTLASAVLCLSGDRDACASLERRSAGDPQARAALERIRAFVR